MSTANVWTAIDVAFAAIIRVIQNKSAGNWQAAAIALEECNASLVEATRQFQALTTNLRNQREHTEAVSLNRVLQSYLVPLLSALMECMHSSPTADPSQPTAGPTPERLPWLSPQILAAIDDQLRTLANSPAALATFGGMVGPLSRLNEINVIRACERLADDHMLGVAFVVRLLRDVSIQRRDLLPYLAAYLQEVGTLSNDASTVITQGIRLSIGDVGSVHARILLAVRYLEIKENFRL
jgi:hypothetical protein